MKSVDGQRRTYRMVARAAAAEATGQRILDAAAGLFGHQPYDDVSLQAVARESGATVQTVIRRFHSKEGLLAEVIARRRVAIHADRSRVRPGEVDRALEVLFEEYERWGDEVLLFLAQEGRNPLIAEAVEAGRTFHHHWVTEMFTPTLKGRPLSGRRAALHQIIAATDLYVWKIFRRDLQLAPRRAQAHIAAMVRAAIA